MSIRLINWNISRGFSVYGNEFKDLLTFGNSESSLLSVSRFSDGGFEIFTLSTGGSLVGFSGTDCFDDLLSFQDFKFLATSQVEMKSEMKSKMLLRKKFSQLGNFQASFWSNIDYFCMLFLTITAIQACRKCKQWASDSVKNHRAPAQIHANPIRKSLGRVLIEILTDYFVDLSLLQAFSWRFEEYRKNGTSCSCFRFRAI